jgi:sigma-B regulation protein RsbU (phosphoserine phosphatase)
MSTQAKDQTIGFDLLGGQRGDWRQRLTFVVEMMRELSLETDPQAMGRTYRNRMRQAYQVDGSISLSRRDLEPPYYRITKSSRWKEDINPWKQKDRLPLLQGGLLGELIYSEEPRIIPDLRVAEDDPAYEYLAGMRSLIASPLFDEGISKNMIVLLREEPSAFDPNQLPEWVWMSNLYGRATQGLILSEKLKETLEIVERELKIVAGIQRSLLPKRLPRIPTLDLAAHYQTSQWAGGDYYDIFPLSDGLWGLLIADVSGHGTPAAVMMAITHAIAHTYRGDPIPPGLMLEFVNHHLATRYTTEIEAFVTAFYGIYDPSRRELRYASAGHNPPRLKRCQDGTIASLDGASGLPLGVTLAAEYPETVQQLIPGDQIIFYTDGITEAVNPSGWMFGLERLDEVLENCTLTAEGLIRAVLNDLEAFTEGHPPADDRTLLVAKVSASA